LQACSGGDLLGFAYFAAINIVSGNGILDVQYI